MKEGEPQKIKEPATITTKEQKNQQPPKADNPEHLTTSKEKIDNIQSAHLIYILAKPRYISSETRRPPPRGASNLNVIHGRFTLFDDNFILIRL